ncbi:conserved protein of unknown function [Petrocella atlantisensis]|uniref:Uncharacterized protein n=1 Tax=Petrocella atlantisensis TaxID=2173034 RepID=A0A3P7NU39_9FIRM|nr:hypothetical protein [Petrocella atlantisensis]VDN46385.1 conserved protein of unknown function [Petrocella atlantisensis]
MKRDFTLNIWAQIITLPFIFIMIFLLAGRLSSYDATYANLNKTALEETVMKYVIQCYASEGSYPPHLEYLSEHYGLILDNEHYIYDYEIFASNIMPNITILDKLTPDIDQ